MTPRSLSIRIPGHWEDGWLYRDHLVLWTTAGEICSVPIPDIADMVERSYGEHLAVLSEQLVLRSERKFSREYRQMMSLPGVADAVLKPLQDGSPTLIAPGLKFRRADLDEAVPGNVVDVAVYGNRIFTATDEGLFEAQYNPNFPLSRSPLLNVIEAETTSVVAGSGIVAVSADGEGLLSRDIEFGDADEWWRSAGNNSPITRVADYSRGVSRSYEHLLNYAESGELAFIRADSEYETRGTFREKVVRGYRPAVNISENVVKVVEESARRSNSPNVQFDWDSEVRVRGNANYRLLVETPVGPQVVDVRAFRGKAVEFALDGKFDFDPQLSDVVSRAVTVGALHSGFLIESLENVSVLGENGSFVLIDEPRVQVRTFPNSKRYDDTVLAVADDFVEIIGFTGV